MPSSSLGQTQWRKGHKLWLRLDRTTNAVHKFTLTTWASLASVFTSLATEHTKAFKNLPADPGDVSEDGSIPGSGRSPGEGNGYPLQYSCLENSMDRGA